MLMVLMVSSHQLGVYYRSYARACAVRTDSSLIEQTHFLFNTIASIYFTTYQTFHHVHTLHMQLFHPKVCVCMCVVRATVYVAQCHMKTYTLIRATVTTDANAKTKTVILKLNP